MEKIPAKVALLRQMQVDGMNIMFGNPGSVEQNLMDALEQVPEVKYVLGLHENVVLAMADGYARVSRRPAVAQVHASVGLANASALLYQAKRSLTPVVVIAGEVDLRLQAFDGFLSANLVDIARPVTKWADRVIAGDQLLRMWRRAVKVAMTPPQGPVFLALPMNVLDEEILPEIYETPAVEWRSVANAATVERVADALLGATLPMLLVGDGVSLSSAQSEVAELAEVLGAPIYGVDFADLNVSFKHPLFQGILGRTFGSQTRSVTLQADVVLAIGTPLFPELFPAMEPYFAAEARLIQLDTNPWEVSKNFPADLGIVADPKQTLRAILEVIVQRKDAIQARENAPTRAQHWSALKAAAHDKRQKAYDEVRDHLPLAPSRIAEVIVNCLPKKALVYDESITSTDELLHYLQPHDPDGYFLGRGGCLGVGWPGAIGAAFASPTRPVLAISADGSALFVVQALWTAAHHGLNVVFVVLNNHSYRILKVNLLHYRGQTGTRRDSFPHMDLRAPSIQFDRIADGFGVPAMSVHSADELREALHAAFGRSGPSLIDVEVDGSVAEEVRTIIRSVSTA